MNESRENKNVTDQARKAAISPFAAFRYAVLVILFVSMATLWALIFFQRLGPITIVPGLDPSFPEDRSWVFSGEYDAKAYSAGDYKRIMPEFIGITADQSRKGICCDDELMSSVFRDFIPVLEAMLSDGSAAISFGSEGRAEYEAALSASPSVVLRFCGAIPDAALLALCTEHGAVSRESSCNIIRTIVVYTDKNKNVRACANDGSGSFTSYFPNTQTASVLFNNFLENEYNTNVGFCDYTFGCLEGDLRGSIQPPCDFDAPIVTSLLKSSTVMILQPMNDIIEELSADSFADTPLFEALLNCFYINPSITKCYKSEDKLIYVDKSMSMTISPDGRIVYEARDGYLLVSKLTGSAGGDRDFESRAKAADVVVSSLPKTLFGGQADLRLSGVYGSESDDTVYFAFDFYYDGIRILRVADRRPGVVVGVTRDEIVRVDMLGVFVGSNMLEKTAVMPYLSALSIKNASAILDGEDKKVISALLCYDAKNYNEWLLADWTFRTETDSSTDNGI